MPASLLFKKVIDAAGFTATAPRYGLIVRNVNKEKRVIAEACIANDDNFNDAIFTDKCSIQLHDNKLVVYRLKDSVAPLIPMPKHPYKVHVWASISRRGTTSILIFDGIMKSSFYIDSILTFYSLRKTCFSNIRRQESSSLKAWKGQYLKSFLIQ